MMDCVRVPLQLEDKVHYRAVSRHGGPESTVSAPRARLYTDRAAGTAGGRGMGDQ